MKYGHIRQVVLVAYILTSISTIFRLDLAIKSFDGVVFYVFYLIPILCLTDVVLSIYAMII